MEDKILRLFSLRLFTLRFFSINISSNLCRFRYMHVHILNCCVSLLSSHISFAVFFLTNLEPYDFQADALAVCYCLQSATACLLFLACLSLSVAVSLLLKAIIEGT